MIGGSVAWAAFWIALIAETGEAGDPAPRAGWRAVRGSGRAISSSSARPGMPGRPGPQAPTPPATDDAAEIGRDEPAEGRDVAETARFSPREPAGGWPPEIAAALQRLELARRAVVTGQAVEAWRFESVRAGYEGMLKAHPGDPLLEEEIRGRLARLGRLEKAAEASRKIEAVLTRSHRRDQDLAGMSRKVAAREQARGKAFHAVGMVQPSARKVEGRKLFTLIAADGSTRAYLDIPPGIEADSLIAHRVGVRGTVHYSEDLGARLITVRDIEEIGARE